MVGSPHVCLPMLEKQEKVEGQLSSNEIKCIWNQSINQSIPQTFVGACS